LSRRDARELLAHAQSLPRHTDGIGDGRCRGAQRTRVKIARFTQMREDERIWAVKELLSDYVKSPSLLHIRDPHSIIRLAQEIVRRIDRGNSIWRKWDGQRETVLKSAIGCWIPIEDLRDFLNRMSGPQLTSNDVSQRLKAFEDEDYTSYPNEDLRGGCLAIYDKERGEGTELPAIIGLLREHVENEEERIRVEHQEQNERRREEDREAQEQRLLSGADCKWTQFRKSQHWYCRANGRAYRLSPTNDKMWQLYRVKAIPDDEEGVLIGKYRARGDATKVVTEMAYKPEPKW
jgi:hypothetical protein